MSRWANKNIPLPQGVEVKVNDREIHAKGKHGEATLLVHESVSFEHDSEGLKFNHKDKQVAFTGTMYSLAKSLLQGVSEGFEKKLILVGVGYRAQVQGKVLNLQLGFSHPVSFPIPEGIQMDTPSQTEIIIKGISKQQVGQVAAEIRRYRPPEPYKGKGVRYDDEVILRKEGKKK
ncbi:MAG: 50S ribosomal protein L6 [Candidatus Oxydemutatoraceae bacterium WSBS_2016_MAG_OTU14]